MLLVDERPAPRPTSAGGVVRLSYRIDVAHRPAGDEVVLEVVAALIGVLDPPNSNTTIEWRRRGRWPCPKAFVGFGHAAFEELPTYSATIPTGKTLGKRWKRGEPYVDPQHWLLGEYVELDPPEPGYIGIDWRQIIVLN